MVIFSIFPLQSTSEFWTEVDHLNLPSDLTSILISTWVSSSRRPEGKQEFTFIVHCFSYDFMSYMYHIYGKSVQNTTRFFIANPPPSLEATRSLEGITNHFPPQWSSWVSWSSGCRGVPSRSSSSHFHCFHHFRWTGRLLGFCQRRWWWWGIKIEWKRGKSGESGAESSSRIQIRILESNSPKEDAWTDEDLITYSKNIILPFQYRPGSSAMGVYLSPAEFSSDEVRFLSKEVQLIQSIVQFFQSFDGEHYHDSVAVGCTLTLCQKAALRGDDETDSEEYESEEVSFPH